MSEDKKIQNKCNTVSIKQAFEITVSLFKDCQEENKKLKQKLQVASEYIKEMGICICDSHEQYTCERCEAIDQIKQEKVSNSDTINNK